MKYCSMQVWMKLDTDWTQSPQPVSGTWTSHLICILKSSVDLKTQSKTFSLPTLTCSCHNNLPHFGNDIAVFVPGDKMFSVFSSCRLTQTVFEIPDVFKVASFPEHPLSLAHISSDGVTYPVWLQSFISHCRCYETRKLWLWRKYVLTFPEIRGLYLDFVSFSRARHTPV